MEEDQRELIERAKNRVRIRPSAAEISQMEAAIAWPARYVGNLRHLLITVGVVALMRARERDMQQAARRLRLPEWAVRRRNGEGLDLIAAGLIADRVRVF
jgi:hypothetical protein